MKAVIIPENDRKEYINRLVYEYSKQMYISHEFNSEKLSLKQSKRDVFDRYYNDISNHFIYRFISNSEEIGSLWLRLVDKRVHIFNIEIYKNFRKRKHSYSIMKYVDQFSINKKSQEIFLYVFKSNYIARRLYVSSGYKEIEKIKMNESNIYTRILMSKEI